MAQKLLIFQKRVWVSEFIGKNILIMLLKSILLLYVKRKWCERHNFPIGGTARGMLQLALSYVLLLSSLLYIHKGVLHVHAKALTRIWKDSYQQLLLLQSILLTLSHCNIPTRPFSFVDLVKHIRLITVSLINMHSTLISLMVTYDDVLRFNSVNKLIQDYLFFSLYFLFMLLKCRLPSFVSYSCRLK